MGCYRFLGCFSGKSNTNSKTRLQNSHIPHHTSKFGKKFNPINQTIASNEDDSRLVVPEEENLNLTNTPTPKEQLNTGAQKRVTVDLNVEAYDHVSCDEALEILGADKERIKAEAESTKPDKSLVSSESESTWSNLGSYPPNHRYQNCRESDDEVSESDEVENELNEDDDDDELHNAELIYDEYCSRQVPEISTKSCSCTELVIESSTRSASNDGNDDERTKDDGSLEKETNTPPVLYRGARDRTGYVHSVLNPVENTAQWKNVKVKQTPSMKYRQKENSHTDTCFKGWSFNPKSNPVDQGYSSEVTVDASLSTWLDSSERTPSDKPKPVGLEPISSSSSTSSPGSNSAITKEERQILAAATSSSPRRSPSRSPNEIPSVAVSRTPSLSSSFKGIPNTTSKYREDKQVTWRSTPFETRLERALKRRC